MATGLELSLDRLRARRQPRARDDRDSSAEFVSKLKRDREKFKRDHPLTPLPSGADDAASKRQHVAPPASPAAQPPSPRPPPYELLVEPPDGDVQSYPVDPALSLRDTRLCLDQPSGWHLRLDGDRLDTAQSARGLGLARGTVLQSFAPQTGGGDEDDAAFQAEWEAEQERLLEEMELEQHGSSRRRQRAAVESGGATNEGSGERPARRQRQRVESEDNESEDDEPTPFKCALCASEKPMQSAVKVDCCNHPDLVCGSCMFTEVCGNAAACPQCRATASALVQVATGRLYKVTDTTLSRLVTQGGELAEPDDPDACHTCHKRGFLLVCDGDGCGQNRCFQCSGLDWPLEDSDPFYCETCAEARAATPMPPDASARQSDAGGVAMVGGGGIAAAQAAPLESEDNEWEGEESEGEESEDGADERGAQQARQTKAQEASERAAKYQEQQRERVHAPAIADSGVQPWDCVSVKVAQLDESKVPDFGTILHQIKIKTKRAVHTGQTELLPTRHNTLLIEAGCSAEKTRKLIKWLSEKLAIVPDMPVLFFTTRKTHTDDLANALAKATGFKNYLDAKATDMSKTKYLSDAKRCIVSLQSIALVNLELYKGGVVVMDEVRSLAAIPGGGTLRNTTRLTQSVSALKALCSGAEYRVAMDADVSADGAVRDWLRLVAPSFDVLHVQLRKAALKREVHMGFTANKSKSAQIMKDRVKLALHHARRSRAEAMEGEAGEQLRGAAVAVIGSLVRVVRGAAGDYALPYRKDEGARDAPVEWRAVSWGLARRAPRSAATRDAVKSAFAGARDAVARHIERVLVMASQPKQADAVVKMADTIGARVAVDEGKYFGKGSDATKRAHFKDTTRAWFWADVVIATSTLSVGVNVRIHFARSFLYTYPGEDAARLRELLQGIVRVGRDADDPLDDERIFALISGWPPKLDFDPRPQPARHREILTRRTSVAAENRRAATAAQAHADARLNPEGMPSAEGEEDLSDPLQSLLAWNQLEAEDNASAQHAIKLVELCKLPTRAWPVHQMEDLSAEEKKRLTAFEKELKKDGAAARLATEDGGVGAMSTAKQYEWFLGKLKRAAEAKGVPLAHEQMAFIAEQEALHSSQKARPEKDCRAQAREAVYEVVRRFTPTAYDVSAAPPWPTGGEEYAKLRICIDELLLRAMLSEIPPLELEVIHEAQRRKDRTAHAQVKTPPYQMRQLLVQFARVLGVKIEWLLVPSTFKPTCRPAADGLQLGKCCDACDESCHEWLRWHNRLRAKVGTDAQKQRDAERQRRLLTIAQKLGAKVTKQALPLTLVARVLSDVLALAPPKEGEKKVAVEAAQHTRCLQVCKPWVVGDAYAERVGAIQLPMLHPERKELLSVRASDWVDEFEKLTGEAVSDAGDFDALLSDAEDEAMGEAAADSGGGGGVSARAFDPKRKAFKVDTKRLLALNSTLEADAEAVATTKVAIDARLSELPNGDAGLKALRKDLARHESLRAVARGMLARCDGLVPDANGWAELTDAYSYRGTGGRRYVDAAALPRVDDETVLERRTATLQGGHSDLRAVCCGEQAFDIDCENGDPRNLLSLAEQTGRSNLVPTWIDYVENRAAYLKEICEVHGCDASVAKRLPNVVGNGGSWGTWLRDNDLKAPAEGSKAFEGKKCKAFLLPGKCRRGEPNATCELAAIRAKLFENTRFKAMVETERERLVCDPLKKKPQHKHDASLWSRIMQTSEDQVLSIIESALFELGWDVFALVFDGLIAAPSAACAEPDVNKALAAAQAACERAGWKVVLALKPLHGLQDEEPKTITKARAAIEIWKCRETAAADMFDD